MEEKHIYTAIIENTPIEVINIIEQELATMIGDGCAHMFVQAIYDDTIQSAETKVTKEHVSHIYFELKKELKGLLGELGLQTLDRKINFSIRTKLGLLNYFKEES